MHQLDPIVGGDIVPAHCLVQNRKGFEVGMVVGSFHQQVEQIDFQIIAVICLKFANDLPQLVQSKYAFSLVLLLKGETPHVDPTHQHVDTLAAIWCDLDVLLLG